MDKNQLATWVVLPIIVALLQVVQHYIRLRRLRAFPAAWVAATQGLLVAALVMLRAALFSEATWSDAVIMGVALVAASVLGALLPRAIGSDRGR